MFQKRHTGRPCIAYDDAVDEALCFGWIDSLIQRLDDARYARKFTPRKADSRWSSVNRKRYAQLKASGRLMPGGLDRAPTSRAYDVRPVLPSKIPQYIQNALEKNPRALAYFETLATSHQRRYLGWIHFARRQETRTRRLKEAIRLLAAGKQLGLR